LAGQPILLKNKSGRIRINEFYKFPNRHGIEGIFCGLVFSLDAVVYLCLSQPGNMFIGSKDLLEISF
jgi:hypothetical protein